MTLRDHYTQALWTMAAVLRSKDPHRTRAAADVLMEAKRSSKDAKNLKDLVAKFTSLQVRVPPHAPRRRHGWSRECYKSIAELMYPRS